MYIYVYAPLFLNPRRHIYIYIYIYREREREYIYIYIYIYIYRERERERERESIHFFESIYSQTCLRGQWSPLGRTKFGCLRQMTA